MKPLRNLTVSLMAIVMMLALQACNWAPWSIVAPPPPMPVPPDTVPAPAPLPDMPPGPVPTPVTTLNITREEYDAALATWRAASAAEYEMVVGYNRVYSELSGVWHLRVKGGQVVDFTRLRNGVPATPEPAVTPDMLDFLTVEAMFEEIERVLDNHHSALLTITGQPFEIEYMVTFDSTLGYPRTLGIYPLYITDNDSYTKVQSLTILQTRP